MSSNAYLARLRFLVVDDNVFMRMLIREVLRAFGAREIAESSNAMDAYEAVRQMTPDIVLVDWEMTPENGLVLVRRIRREPDSPNPFLPVIMVSGYSEESRVLAARDAGVNEFVVKPLSAASLISRIQWVIDKPRSYVKTATYFGPDRRRKKQPFRGDDRRRTDVALIAPGKKASGETVYLDVDGEADGTDADADKGA